MAKNKKSAPVDDELDLDDLEDVDTDEDEEEDLDEEIEDEDEDEVEDDDEEEDEDEAPKKGKKGKKGKAGKTKAARADGLCGTAELATALGTDGRNLRVMLRAKGLHATDFENGRYEWPSVEAAIKQLGFKSLDAAKKALTEARAERLTKLKEAQAAKKAAATASDDDEDEDDEPAPPKKSKKKGKK